FPSFVVRFRNPRIALAVPYLGATRVRLRSQSYGDASCGCTEEVRALRVDSNRLADAAGSSPRMDQYPGLALPGQSRVLRLGCHATKRFQLAGRIFECRPHGLRFSRHRHLEFRWRDGSGACDDCAWLSRGPDVRSEWLSLSA